MESIWNLCKRATLKKPRIATVAQDTWLEQWLIPAGMQIRAFETKNFGWIILPEHPIDKRGFEIPKRIFKY